MGSDITACRSQYWCLHYYQENPPFTVSTDTFYTKAFYEKSHTQSWHCDMTSTVSMDVCTYINIFGDAGSTTVFHAQQDWHPVTAPVTFAITAGFEKLSPASTTNLGLATPTSSGSFAGKTSATASGHASAASSGAANVYGLNVGTVGILGLLVSFVVR